MTDPSGAVVPDVQITASSARNPLGVKANTGSNGAFSLLNLPTGTYVVTYTKTGFATVKQNGVEVRLGSQVTANAKLEVSSANQIVEVSSAATSLDTTSSRVDTTINQSTFENLYKSRNFQSILALAPGVRQEIKGGNAGVGGIQVDGASGSENTYYIDGVEVTDVIRGSLRQQKAIPLDFIQDVNIRTGGFEAEYGGATGGVVNVSIRGGSNAFHGLAFMEGTGSPLNARDRGYYQRSPASADLIDFFKPKEDDYKILYPGGDLGGRIIRDRLFFFAGYSPEFEKTTRTNAYTSGTRTFNQSRTRQYAVGRLDYAASSKLQLFGTYIWSPFRRQGTLPTRDIRVAAPNNDLSIQGGYVPSQAVSTGATYAATSRLTLSARYGYNYLNDKDSNYGLAADPFVTYNTNSNAAFQPVPASVAFANNYANVTTTLGTLRDITTRQNVYVDGSYIVSLGGQQHTFKAGYALNRISQDIASDYTNGRFTINWGDRFSRASISNRTGAYGYYAWEDGVRLNSKVAGRNQGFYLQDGWRVTPRITLNLGVRLENEFLPPYRAEVNGRRVANPVSFSFGDKIAPRIGGAWDVLGDGRWKVAGSFGLFYDTMKYSLAQGSFGGQQWITHIYELNSPNVFSLSKANPGALGPQITQYDNRTVPINAQGELEGIDPDLKPYKSRDFNVSVDRQLSSRLTASLRYARKDLLRALEDIGVLDAEGSEVYVIGNPGSGETRDTSTAYGRKTPNGQEFLVPNAVRQYDAVEFSIRGQIGHLNLNPSYTWSRLYGNYSGLANSDESGRSDPGVSRAYDLPYYYFDQSGSQKNVYGLLGTDRPHAFKFFGSYDLRTKLGSSVIGINQIAWSGTPDTTTVIYLSAPTTPFGRGDLGRTPFLTQTDLFFSHEVKTTENTRLKFTLDVRNLLNQATVISRVTQINRTSALNFDEATFFRGYDVRQTVFPGNTTAAARYNPSYRLPGATYNNGGGPGSALSSAFAATTPNFGAYQDFRTLRLGLRFTF